MKTVAVYCSSSNNIDELYKEAGVLTGQALAKNNIELVFGGSVNGLMGIVAKSVLEHGGRAIGVLPKVLEKHEIAFNGLTELVQVTTMHERKQVMIDRAEGFIVLPGGAGTMEEFFEVFTWSQIGLIPYPIGLLNVNGYYDALITFLRQMTAQNFMQGAFLDALIVEPQIDVLIEKMQQHASPQIKNFK